MSGRAKVSLLWTDYANVVQSPELRSDQNPSLKVNHKKVYFLLELAFKLSSLPPLTPYYIKKIKRISAAAVSFALE